ncbi:MAG: FitA-like ribbon-helix-helix domain-containing protein [Micromonosporaceae bacterium]
MATLQVKNLDESLHTALRTRAEQEGTTLSELVTRIIRRELARPSMADWLTEVRKLPRHDRVDSAALIDEVRADIDRH